MVTLSYHFSPWDRDTGGFYDASSEQNATQNLKIQELYLQDYQQLLALILFLRQELI